MSRHTSPEHFLWMQGRFVGAEKANRNGAFWTTEDLELGELTVRHGPLNWLHEARHVIGTIADTRMVKRDEQLAMDLDRPHVWQAHKSVVDEEEIQSFIGDSMNSR